MDFTLETAIHEGGPSPLHSPRFVKKEIEFARAGVGIQLLVPSHLFANAKPLDDAPVFLRGQSLDSRLDLLNSAHTWSLSPSRTGFHRFAPAPYTAAIARRGSNV